jgi:hypothetical protein
LQVAKRDLARSKLHQVTRREVREPAPTCRTFFETSCTTKYVEQSPGKFAGDTTCEKIPIELCGTGAGNFVDFLLSLSCSLHV